MTTIQTAAPTVRTASNSWVAQLCRAAQESDQWMQMPRFNWHELLKEQAGPYFGVNPISSQRPLNLFYSLVSTLEPSLALQEIRTDVLDLVGGNQWFGNRLSSVADELLRNMKAGRESRRCIRDSLSGMGIIKMFIPAGGKDGMPKIRCISLDDYLPDSKCTVRRTGEYRFEGHKFRFPLSRLEDADYLSGYAKDRIRSLSQAAPANAGKAAAISQTNTQTTDSDYESEVELAEFYLPREDRIVWLPGTFDCGDSKPLYDEEWNGPPESSPLKTLVFCEIADNQLNLPLMAVLYDLYDFMNKIFVKVGMQAKNQKSVAVVENAILGEAIRNEADGGFVLSNGGKFQMAQFMGPVEALYGALAMADERFKQISGNTSLLGGLRAESKTLGQDQMLMQGVGVHIADMKGIIRDMHNELVNDLVWYIWNNDQLKLDRRAPVAKAGTSLPSRWRPGVRIGDLSDYRVSALDAPCDTPEQRYQKLRNLLIDIALPLAPLAAQQGSHLNVDVAMNMAGGDLEVPELEDLWVEGAPQQNPAGVSVQAQPAQQGPGGMPQPRMLPGQTSSPTQDMAVAAAGQGAGNAG
jgi:hypothetical protein